MAKTSDGVKILQKRYIKTPKQQRELIKAVVEGDIEQKLWRRKAGYPICEYTQESSYGYKVLTEEINGEEVDEKINEFLCLIRDSYGGKIKGFYIDYLSKIKEIDGRLCEFDLSHEDYEKIEKRVNEIFEEEFKKRNPNQEEREEVIKLIIEEVSKKW